MQSRSPIRVLLVEDHTVFREGLRSLLVDQELFALVGEAATSQEALKLVPQEKPDVILLGLMLSDGSSLASISHFCATRPSAKVIVLTGISEEEMLSQAVLSGAMGIVRKREPLQVLLKSP